MEDGRHIEKYIFGYNSTKTLSDLRTILYEEIYVWNIPRVHDDDRMSKFSNCANSKLRVDLPRNVTDTGAIIYC